MGVLRLECCHPLWCLADRHALTRLWGTDLSAVQQVVQAASLDAALVARVCLQICLVIRWAWFLQAACSSCR